MVSIFIQAKNYGSDYKNVDSILCLIESKMSIEQSQSQKLDSINRNLKEQLIIYKAKEDYFAAALSDQSNRFILIVTILLALLGLFSFSWYSVEKKKINRKFKSFGEEISKMKKENAALNADLCKTSGNAYAVISKTERRSGSYINSFRFAICAARENTKAKMGNGNDFSIAIVHLNEAKKDFEIIVKDVINVSQVIEIKNGVFDDLDIIHMSNAEEIKVLCSEIRVAVSNFTK